jgi:hypothetical protein
LRYFLPQLCDAFLDGLLHADRLAEQASVLPLWCKPLKAASIGQVNPDLQLLFTKHVEKRNQTGIAGERRNKKARKIKRAVTLVML